LKRSPINVGEDVWKRQATPLNDVHIFVQVGDFAKRWHFTIPPQVKNACEDWHLPAVLVKIQNLQQISG